MVRVTVLQFRSVIVFFFLGPSFGCYGLSMLNLSVIEDMAALFLFSVTHYYSVSVVSGL